MNVDMPLNRETKPNKVMCTNTNKNNNNDNRTTIWNWNFKRGTESILKATQNNAIRTNDVKAKIDNAL